MRIRELASILVCGPLLAPVAAAESYRVLQGFLSDAETGEVAALTGTFDASVSGGGPLPEPFRGVLRVDDFRLEAGTRSFAPRQPIEFDGLSPTLYVEIADQISLLEDDRIGLVALRSGGQLVAESADEVTFRFLELRSSGASSGRFAGPLGETGLPRRLDLRGSLYEVDQRFEIMRGDDCPVFPVPIPPGGGDGGAGFEITGAGGVILTHGSFEIDRGEGVAFVPPSGGAVVIGRVSDRVPAVIEGEIRGDGAVVLVNPAPLPFGPVVSATAPILDPPTLEELGITAPSGAVVTYDDSGALTVTTEGDLIIEGAFIDLPGLTSVTLVAAGSIIVTGGLTFPPEVDVFLESGDVPPDPGDIVVVPSPLCHGLRPIFVPGSHTLGAEVGRKLGSFSLVATAAQPTAIDVWPGREANRVMPGSRQRIPVAILGAEDLDVWNVDLRSLRLGRGEASPRRLWRFLRVLRRDVNRDGFSDLVAWFSTREAEIAYGQTTVCLHGEKTDGTLFEGCGAIDTRPTWMRWSFRDFFRQR